MYGSFQAVTLSAPLAEDGAGYHEGEAAHQDAHRLLCGDPLDARPNQYEAARPAPGRLLLRPNEVPAVPAGPSLAISKNS